MSVRLEEYTVSRYFKLVSLRHGWTDWLLERFLNGQVHFGWGWPGMDLRVIGEKPRHKRSDREALAWRQTKFLLKRIKPGDRLVLQFEQPLRRFMLAEVSGPYGFLDPPEDDFNHYRVCTPLTPRYIDMNSDLVPAYLRHALTKRGQYYEIYPQPAIRQLTRIVDEELWNAPNAGAQRTVFSELELTENEVQTAARKMIAQHWPAQAFERFVAALLDALGHVEVKPGGDSGKGWDLLVRILDPITGETLADDVPVQCKNYTGAVTTTKPLDDIARAIRNSDGAGRGYLFILGQLSDDYFAKAARLEQELAIELERDITIQVVDEAMIAQMYLQHLVGKADAQVAGASGPQTVAG